MVELRRFLIGWLLVIIVAGLFLFVAPLFKNNKSEKPVISERVCALYERECAGVGVWLIEEDDPRWDCHTMGNGRCGNE